jgi:hypothetical protein
MKKEILKYQAKNIEAAKKLSGKLQQLKHAILGSAIVINLEHESHRSILTRFMEREGAQMVAITDYDVSMLEGL